MHNRIRLFIEIEKHYRWRIGNRHFGPVAKCDGIALNNL